MRLFGRYRREEQEAQARATLDALSTLVHGPSEPLWAIDVICECKTRFVQDPANTQRWICGRCHAVLRISTERAPDRLQPPAPVSGDVP